MKLLSLIFLIASSSASASTAKWVNINEHFYKTMDYVDAYRSLSKAFNVVCGDTFCEGEYSNWESLGLNCSVSVGTGTIGDCKWIFGGAGTEVNPVNGKISYHQKVVSCDLDFKGLNAKSVVREINDASKTMKGSELLNLDLKGNNVSIYDQLMKCIP